MAVVQANGATVGTYSYNALGQRIQKTTTAPTTTTQRYFYDEQSHLIGEYTVGGNNRDTIWLGDMPVATVDTTGSTSVVNFVIGDGLGTPRAVVNAAGTTIWSWAYAGNPFGEQQPTSMTGYVLNLRYPGQYYDAESGTNYNLNRTYEPAIGRYLQSDPIGLDGGISTYVYGLNNLLAYTDPLGLCPGDPQDSGEEGRSEFCQMIHKPNESWLARKLLNWGCKKVAATACDVSKDGPTCCSADFRECMGANGGTPQNQQDPPPENPRDAMRYGQCQVKFVQCIGTMGKKGE
jgi:RHS repeat-associated protein